MPGVTLQCCKRWSTYITMACFFLAGGIEYSVILPTMYDYVRKFGGEEWLYGLSLSAFSISNLVASPLYGLVFDKTKMTKLLVIFANLFEVGGNFVYFSAYAAQSKYLILGSRFLVGLGAGAGATIFAELALTTTSKQRTTIFSLFMAMRQLGMVIGPAFNLFLQEASFSIGPFPVNPLSSPGIFMMALWVVVELMFIFLFYHLPRTKQDTSAKGKPTTHAPPVTHATIQSHLNPGSRDTESVSVQGDEKTPLISSETDPASGQSHQVARRPAYGSTSPELSSPTINNTSQSYMDDTNGYTSFPYQPQAHSSEVEEEVLVKGTGCAVAAVKLRERVFWLISELIREEIVVLLAILFITFFSQASAEAMFVPMAKNLLTWEEKEISYFYSGAGLEIIVSFVFVSLVSRKLGDRWQMLAGLICEIICYGWMLGLVGNATSDTPWVLWRYLIGGAILLWGLPPVIVTGASLYSKLLPPQIQGFGQGVRRSVFSVGAILGPLWAGGAVSFGGTYYVLLGVPAGLFVLVLLLLVLSFNHLKEPTHEKNTESAAQKQTAASTAHNT